MAKFLIDMYAVMQHVPDILGMELTWRKDAWEGRYYLNGDRHPYKKDKLKVKFWKAPDGRTHIVLHEQGNNSMSLQSWLIAYGGASDYKEAINIMRGCRPCSLELGRTIRKREQEVVYVERAEFERFKEYDLNRCNLFVFMCRLFGEERVREVWERYNVTTDERGNVCYFYSDAEGRIIHDKVMRYNGYGKRDKQFITRRFKTSDGFRGRAYYGAHLVEDDKRIVLMESEKSVLLSACYFGMDGDTVFLATGGKGNVRDVDERTWLAPDIDAISEWSSVDGAQIYEWWNEFGGAFDSHDDIGDAIVRKMLGDYRGGERYM